MKKTKFLSVLLAAALTLTSVPMLALPAVAAEPTANLFESATLAAGTTATATDGGNDFLRVYNNLWSNNHDGPSIKFDVPEEHFGSSNSLTANVSMKGRGLFIIPDKGAGKGQQNPSIRIYPSDWSVAVAGYHQWLQPVGEWVPTSFSVTIYKDALDETTVSECLFYITKGWSEGQSPFDIDDIVITYTPATEGATAVEALNISDDFENYMDNFGTGYSPSTGALNTSVKLAAQTEIGSYVSSDANGTITFTFDKALVPGEYELAYSVKAGSYNLPDTVSATMEINNTRNVTVKAGEAVLDEDTADTPWESKEATLEITAPTTEISFVADKGLLDIADYSLTLVEAYDVPVETVTLDQDAIELTVGGATATLTATVAPDYATDKAVTWTASPEGVVTVVDGVVTAVKGGTATITATAGEAFDTCEVTVIQPATGVELDETLVLIEGYSAPLTATVLPEDATNKNVTWNVVDEDDVIDFDEVTGTVTAKKPGAATITVTTEDGEFTAACAVTVKAREAYVENSVKLVAVADKEDVNVGETITVEVYATTDAEFTQVLDAANFVLDYDAEKLEFVSIVPSDAVKAETYVDTAEVDVPAFSMCDDPKNATKITIAADADVLLATATFNVLTKTDEDVVSVGFVAGDANVTLIGAGSYNGYAPETTSDEVTVHNIVLTVDTNAITIGETTAVYAKYNEAGLYTDNTYATPATLDAVAAIDGYRLGDAEKDENTWLLDGETFVPGTDAITKSGTLSHYIVKVWTVTVTADPAEGATIDNEGIFTVDADANLIAAIEGSIHPVEGYAVKSYLVDSAPINAEYKVTADTAVVVELYEIMPITFIYKFNPETAPEGYQALATGTKIAVIKTAANLDGESVGNTMTYTYNNEEFFYAERLGGYAMIVDEALTSETISKGITFEETATDAVIEYDGDLSGDDKTASGDAAMLSAMLHNPDGDYFDYVRLAADVTDGEGYVTVADVLWILREAVHLNTVDEAPVEP